jgi:hypothetical protein
LWGGNTRGMMGGPLIVKGGSGNKPREGCASFCLAFVARKDKKRRKFVEKRAQKKRKRRNQDTCTTHTADQMT